MRKLTMKRKKTLLRSAKSILLCGVTAIAKQMCSSLFLVRAIQSGFSRPRFLVPAPPSLGFLGHLKILISDKICK